MISSVEKTVLVGKYVDFKDNTTYEWQVGFVVSQTGNKVKVRSEGWSDKYDENISLTSDRIKPFRSLVRGYTGQKKKPALRDHWKYSPQDHEERLQYFNGFRQSWEHEEESWNQFVRGSHYFYLDSLMGQTFKDTQEMMIASEYLKSHISFVKEYLERLIKIGCRDWLNGKQRKLEREACYEIFDGIYVLAALYPRHSSFTKNNEKIIAQLTGDSTYEANITALINQIGLDLVYSKMVDLLDENQVEPLPIYFMHSFFRMFFVIEKSLMKRVQCGQMEKEARKKLAFVLVSSNQYLYIVMRRNIDQLKSEDLKSSQNQRDVESLLSDLFTISFKYGLEKLMFQWIKKTKTRCSAMLIEADSVERKLKGISQLKELFEMTLVVSEYTMYQLSSKEFMQIVHQNQVIEKLFVHNDHPEIAKKGGELWLFFYKNGVISFKQLEFIWVNCMNKHESVKKIAFQLWIDSIAMARKDLPLFVSKLVNTDAQKQEPSSFEEWQLEMLINYSQKLFKFNSELKAEEKISGVDITQISKDLLMVCYQHLLKTKSEQGLNEKIINFAKLIIYCEDFNNIIKECYVQIGKGEKVALHCELLYHLYSNSSRAQTFMATNALKILFAALENHEALSESIFKLITQIASFSSIYGDYQIFNLEQFETLWKISHTHPETRKNFFKWLLKEHLHPLSGTRSYEINAIIYQQLRTQIFKNFLCDFSKVDYINLTLEELDIFREFLLDCNMRESRIEITFFAGMLRVIKIKDQEIIGNKFVWDIFMNCKNQEVLKKLNQIIVILNLHTETLCSEKVRLGKLSVLMAKIEKNLKDGYRKGNYRILNASLDLLKATIDFSKQKPEEKLKNQVQHFKFNHKIKFEGKLCQLQTSFSCSYKELKQKISEQLKITVTKFKLLNGKKEIIGSEFCFVPFCFMQEKELEVVKISSEEQTSISFILDFVASKIQSSLITMIEDEEICQNIYELWKDLSIKEAEIQSFIEKITKSISNKKNKNEQTKTSKSEIYSLLLLLRFMQNISDQALQQTASINSAFILDLVQLLGSDNVTTEMIELLSTSTIMILKLFKILSQKQAEGLSYLKKIQQNLCNRCLSEIQIISKSMDKGAIDQSEKIRVAKISLNCLNIVETVKRDQTLEYLFNNASFIETIKVIYLSKSISTSKLIVTEKLKKIVKTLLEKVEMIPEDIEIKIFELFCSTLYPQVRKKDGNYSLDKGTFHIYSIIGFLISKASDSTFKKFISDSSFCDHIITELFELKDKRNELSCNYILKGHLDILASIIKRNKKLLSPQLLESLLYNHLFFSQGKTRKDNVNCLHKDSVQSCLKVLLAGARGNSQVLSTVIECLNEFQEEKYWKIDNNWCIESQPQNKQKYKGLQNPGCICFMNSFLQQLFMNNFFKNSILSTQTQLDQNSLPSEVLFKLKKLFLEMTFSEESTLSSVPFSRSIKGYDDKQMISIYNQMDIDQFSNILFDRMELQLKGLGLEDFVKNIFGGTFAQQIVSHQCPHSSEREQDFLSIGLEVRKNIQDSFASLVKGEMLDGQNKYYCERCDKKVKAEKILSIKTLPECLIVALKRFEYNFDYDAKIKINDICEFPHELNIKKFTQREILSHLLQNQNQLNQALTKSSQSQDEKDYLYRLKGVVIHLGSADSGHYYSIIRSQDNRWIEFNDSHISSFNIQNLPEQAFGSKDETDTKNKNAYLLFYEKITNTLKAETLERSFQIDENKKIISKIQARNKQIEKSRIFFSEAYSQFINTFWFSLQSDEGQLKSQFNSFLISYYSTVRLREASMDKFISFSKKISKLIEDDPQSRTLFLRQFQNLAFLEELFVYCTMRHKCEIISHLWAEAFDKELNQNPNSLQEGGLLWNIAKNVMNLILLYGNINQVFKFVRMIFETKDERVFKMIIQMSFHIVCLGSLLGRQGSIQQKKYICQGKNLKFDREEDDQDSYFDKKYITPNKIEGWKVLESLITYLSSFDGECPELSEMKIILINDINGDNYHKVIYEIKNGISLQIFYSCLKRVGLIFDLLPSIERGFKDFESTKFRPLLILCSLIIKDKDSDEEVLKNLSDILEKMLAINEKYFLESNLLLQWIIQFINSNELFWKCFTEDQETIDRILAWIDKHKKPSIDLVKKHKNPLNERLLNRINGILVSVDPKEYEENSDKMSQIFNFMKDEGYNQKISKINEPKVSRGFKLGQQVKIFNLASGIYRYGKVIEVSFGKLKVKVQGVNSTSELDEDDELLMPLAEEEIKGRAKTKESYPSKL